MRTALFLALFTCASCEDARPKALVICHNSNCGHTDPWRDGTMDALYESLALEYQERATIDGLEMDVIWDRSAQRCVFEHDHADAAGAPDLMTAVAAVGDHLRARGPRASWNQERFYVKLELKSGAAPSAGPLTPGETMRLVDCVLAATEALELAGAEGGLPVTTIYDSEDLQLLAALTDGAAWRDDLSGPRRARQLAVGWLSEPSPALQQWVGILSVYWREVDDGDYTLFRDLEDRGIDAMLSMFDANEEVLDTVAYAEPAFVSTNEAPLFRQWLSPGW